MNSPTEPGSPTFSTASSESPPPEETNFQPSQNTSQLATQVAASLYSSGNPGSPTVTAGPSASGSHHGSAGVPSSKRRQPHGAHARDRDAKTRRREPRTGAGGVWESQGGKEGGRKDKDEFVDTHIAESLRKEIGDPFLEIES